MSPFGENSLLTFLIVVSVIEITSSTARRARHVASGSSDCLAGIQARLGVDLDRRGQDRGPACRSEAASWLPRALAEVASDRARWARGLFWSSFLLPFGWGQSSTIRRIRGFRNRRLVLRGLLAAPGEDDPDLRCCKVHNGLTWRARNPGPSCAVRKSDPPPSIESAHRLVRLVWVG